MLRLPPETSSRRSTAKGSSDWREIVAPTTWGWSKSAAPSWMTSATTSFVFFPRTKTLLALVCRMNREPIRSSARSVANAEFHHVGDHVNEVSRAIVSALEQMGVRAVNPTMGFPMEMDRFPAKIWVVGHKPIAVAAGLGRMGIHRNVIHPRFGNFILLGTVLLEAEATAYDQPHRLQPLPRMQTLRRRVPRRCDLARWPFRFLRLLHSQLSRVHGWVQRLGRADRR